MLFEVIALPPSDACALHIHLKNALCDVTKGSCVDEHTPSLVASFTPLSNKKGKKKIIYLNPKQQLNS